MTPGEDHVSRLVARTSSAHAAPRPIPEGPGTVDAAVRIAAAQWPRREALVGRHARYNFAALHARVEGATRFLASLGLAQGDRLAATAVNDTELVVAFLAAMRLGLIWVGIGRALTMRERAEMLLDCGARVYLADAETLAKRAEAGDAPLPLTLGLIPGDPDCDWSRGLALDWPAASYAPPDPLAPAAIAYTSGTTGSPKGAVHSQHNIVALAAANRAFGRAGQWEPSLRRGVALPLTILNLMALGPVTALVNGSACVCMDRIDALGIAEWVKAEGIQTFAGAPTTIHDLLTRPDIDQSKLASLILPTAGGGHVTDDLRALYRARFGVELGTGYGLTEAMAGVAETDPDGASPAGSCGRAYPHIEIGIDRGDGVAAVSDEPGEIRVRAVRKGPWAHVYSPMLGYWERPEATREALRDGWLYTGDIGALDGNGYLTIKDRRNDLIIRGGANIYPAEIERILAAEPGVRAGVVVGLADERLGERVVAVIEADGTVAAAHLEQALRARCSAGLARYKHPEFYLFVDALPRNAMNKVIKARVKELVAGQLAGD
ncbi:class I adenylate-forming enzyme family protein [Novosphingobium sp.]|uniref:class I adenylate-forming enzyme family protein n=1 Tax=Novosphingobium sp. TaxID=1874826 RepID=UPI003BABC8CC